MLGLADIRNWLKTLENKADNYYIGKLDNKNNKSIGVYQGKNIIPPRITLGGSENSSYEVKAITVLIHWNLNARETEEFSYRLFEEILKQNSVVINNHRIKMIKLNTNEPIDVGTDEKGIYETTDYDGNPTYYYRGSVENNYLKFSGYYWRIIRINSNGSIRMIYDGTIAHSNGESSTDRQYDRSHFNTIYDKNEYLGYMYSVGEAHGIGTSSTIKENVDKFYIAKLSNFSSKIDTSSGYCGDRSSLNLLTGTGTGTVTTYNAGYLRVIESTPTLICENASDYYTVSNATIGNKALAYPIGLISIDEVMFAGHAGGIFSGKINHQVVNKTNYLAIGNVYWTMTPVGGFEPFGESLRYTTVFGIRSDGTFGDYYVGYNAGIRPVVNIRSDVTITGSGTMTDPYVIN